MAQVIINPSLSLGAPVLKKTPCRPADCARLNQRSRFGCGFEVSTVAGMLLPSVKSSFSLIFIENLFVTLSFSKMKHLPSKQEQHVSLA